MEVTLPAAPAAVLPAEAATRLAAAILLEAAPILADLLPEGNLINLISIR